MPPLLSPEHPIARGLAPAPLVLDHSLVIVHHVRVTNLLHVNPFDTLNKAKHSHNEIESST